MPTIPRTFIGSAGEHFVAYRLSAMGYLVALTRGGSPSVDLMVATPDGQNTLTIQVKTGNKAFVQVKKKPENTNWCWPVNSKVRQVCGESLFYAFVDLQWGAGEPPKSMPMPDVFIVRSSDIQKENLVGPPNRLWFVIMKEDEEKKWHKNDWHLIEERLPLPKG